ncbi:hypothetical protein ACN9JZ_03715 [Aliarcobacter butzleri]|uniref:hypothetical protein n=1 Tax=Aliarcobacter butzleri TaxID=28197 RepID=UPI003AF8ADA9
MILNITDELIDARNNLKDFYLFFNNIMLAYRESKHIICISPKKVKDLLEEEKIKKDETILQTLNHYKNHAKEQNLINMKFYFNLVINIVLSNEKKENLANIEYRDINYSKFLDSSSIQKTILLGEHSKDIEVYKIFVEYYKNKFNLNYKFDYTKQGGGGNSIKEEYKTIYESADNFCLCLLDSDKRFHKQSKFGSTAQQVVDFQNSQNNINYKIYYYVLEVLELENHLPKDFYINKYSTKSYVFEIIEKLISLDSNFRKYFDFKSGIICKATLNEQTGSFSCDKGYLKEYLCPLVAELKLFKENKTMVEGFSQNILEDFVKYPLNDITNFVDNDDFVKKSWLKIGKYIASHTLVPQTKKVI